MYKVKFVSFIRVFFLAEKMECALKINNSNKVDNQKNKIGVELWVAVGGFMITFFGGAGSFQKVLINYT